MSLKSRIESLERQAGIRELQQDEERFATLTDEELDFFWCHGCYPQELQGRVVRHERHYTDGRFCVTIILERVE
jgi:hypothetical protein